MNLDETKNAARVAAKNNRLNIAANSQDGRAAKKVARTFISKVSKNSGLPIAGYFPIGSELDIRVLFEELHINGCQCCLPMIRGVSDVLEFGSWCSGDSLVKSKYGIKEPRGESKRLIPKTIVAPMLAFDKWGYRLGYGGGYYDRTIARLRKLDSKILVVGVAFAGQEVDHVPKDIKDQKMDMIITEEGSFWC